MAAPEPHPVALAIRGPIARADLPGLCDRVCSSLQGSGAGLAVCDVGGVEPDAVTVDALARLQLAARRHGCQVRLRGASSELLELVAFMGLSNVLPGDEFSRSPRSVARAQKPGGTMNRKLFVNIAVADLDRSVDFFTKLGFEFNPQFTDETATCMLVGQDAYFMLLTDAKFREFAKKEPADPMTHTGAFLAITAENREEVDGFVDRALELGATPADEASDLGFMYGRGFFDLDGHHWSIFWMDPAALEESS